LDGIKKSNMSKSKIIDVNGTAIIIYGKKQKNYISLTDKAKYRKSTKPYSVINNWMRSRSTIDFVGRRGKLCNPIFKPLEFGGVKTFQ
jgi:hypothetical protein